jgi:hypothetical protein
MTHTRASRSTWWLGVLLTLLTLSVCAPTARASCGDYVHIGSKTHNAADRESNPATPNTAEPAVPPDTPRPCHGPACEQRLPAPLAPAPVPPRPSVDRWACLITALTLTPHLSSPCLPPAVPGNPAKPVDDIFHPPRS